LLLSEPASYAFVVLLQCPLGLGAREQGLIDVDTLVKRG
jgi:hypothetical protein